MLKIAIVALVMTVLALPTAFILAQEPGWVCTEEFFAEMEAHFLERGDPGFLPVDLNRDGLVDLSDFSICAANWEGNTQPEPESAASQNLAFPAVSNPSITPSGDCRWDIWFQLSSFTPNATVTVSSQYTEVVCVTGFTETHAWSTEAGQTDGAGMLQYGVVHQGTGSYTYTFTDVQGQSVSVSFSTATVPPTTRDAGSVSSEAGSEELNDANGETPTSDLPLVGSTTEPATEQWVKVVLPAGMWVRNGPGVEYERIGRTQADTDIYFELLETQNGWHHVRWSGEDGWIAAGDQYVQSGGGQTVDTSPPSALEDNTSPTSAESVAAPSGENVTRSMDFNGYCVSQGHKEVERTRDDAYSWACDHGGSDWRTIDTRQLCAWQYQSEYPYVSLGNPSDSGSWHCNSLPQPMPAYGYITKYGVFPNDFRVSSSARSMDFNAYCVSQGHKKVERTRDDAYSWACDHGGQDWRSIDTRHLCSWQYGTDFSYVNLGNMNDPGSWRCEANPQPEPPAGYITYYGTPPTGTNVTTSVPGACPFEWGARTGIQIGDYNPTELTHAERQDLFDIFEGGGDAPIGYGGKPCVNGHIRGTPKVYQDPFGTGLSDSNNVSPDSGPELTGYSGWTTLPTEPGSYVLITVDRLNVRASASVNANVLGQLFNGNYYRLIETSGDWGKIEPPNWQGPATFGWIYLPGFTTLESFENPPVVQETILSPAPNDRNYDLDPAKDAGHSAQLNFEALAAEADRSTLVGPDSSYYGAAVDYLNNRFNIYNVVGDIGVAIEAKHFGVTKSMTLCALVSFGSDQGSDIIDRVEWVCLAFGALTGSPSVVAQAIIDPETFHERLGRYVPTCWLYNRAGIELPLCE